MFPPSECLFLAFLTSSASENSLSDVGSHFTVFDVPNLPVGLFSRVEDVAVLLLFEKPFSFLAVNSWTMGTSMSLARL